jgi:phospholipid transport system substrate-binding protein
MFARRSITALSAGLLTLAAALGAVLSAAAQDPREIVQETSDRVLEIINKRGKELERDPQERKRLIDEIIAPVIDFEAFSQLVLGLNWRTATPEQRERFMNAFKNMLTRTYTNSLSDYAGTQVVVLPARGEQRRDYRTVYTEIRSNESQSSLSVYYSFRRLSDGHWKAYDVTIDGLSLVKNFRTSFGHEIERHGLNALIERLEHGGKGLAPEEPAQ